MVIPFYSRQIESVVVGEMCKCGHPRASHGSQTRRVDGQLVRLGHHDGNCCDSHCECKQFTWDKWITESEVVEQQQIPVKVAS